MSLADKRRAVGKTTTKRPQNPCKISRTHFWVVKLFLIVSSMTRCRTSASPAAACQCAAPHWHCQSLRHDPWGHVTPPVCECAAGRTHAIRLTSLWHTCRHGEACLINHHVITPCSHKGEGAACGVTARRNSTQQRIYCFYNLRQRRDAAGWLVITNLVRTEDSVQSTRAACLPHAECTFPVIAH